MPAGTRAAKAAPSKAKKEKDKSGDDLEGISALEDYQSTEEEMLTNAIPRSGNKQKWIKK